MVKNQNRVYIFDIDGCICENFFPNLSGKANIRLLKERILKNALELDFVVYFIKIANCPGTKTYFITGRRSKDFREENLKQLEPLKIREDQVIFFPDNYSHSIIRYSNFKIFHILSIAAKNKNREIVVFDDLDEYVSKLLNWGLKLKLNKRKFNLVKNPKKFWKLMRESR